MSKPADRLANLLDENNTTVTGIDFVNVEKSQTELLVYFYHTNALIPKMLLHALLPENISIRSLSKTRLSQVAIIGTGWLDDNTLRISLGSPGDFTLYRLRIESGSIDPFFDNIIFNFKVHCHSDLDCQAEEHVCPPEPETDFPIDYLARDFRSFRSALFEFAAQRYPDWKERLEADAGIMMAEMMSAAGDEMAYYQDRIAREAYLETAFQRRSVRRHARLMDYDLDDGQGSSTWIDFTVDTDDTILSGTVIYARNENGKEIFFETGAGLEETLIKVPYQVKKRWNLIKPYRMDESSFCLPAGTTAMYLEGDYRDLIDKWILLETDPEDPSCKMRRHLVRVIATEQFKDALNNNLVITLIEWKKNQALPFEMSISPESRFTIRGNMILATAGKKHETDFIIGVDHQNYERAVEREGHDGTVTYLFSLQDSDINPLVRTDFRNKGIIPQIELCEIEKDTGLPDFNASWQCRSSLVGTRSSDADDPHFTLDDGIWRRVVGYQRSGIEIIHKDYATGNGTTIRFGDGEFGRIPAEGTVFRVFYRLGGGADSNIPAGAVKYLEKPDGNIVSLRNPFPATNGRDPEIPDQIKKLAPYRFRSVMECAVIASDYAEAAERLEWIQKAGASFRWTGSWLTAFVTPDPKNSVTLTVSQRDDLIGQLDRFRQAGREVHIMDPFYADINLEITICVAPGSYRGEVKEKVIEALFGRNQDPSQKSYFSADNFTFGTLLDRSALEAAIQSVPGVNAIMGIRYKRRGWFDWSEFTDSYYDPGKNSIIRVENDPIHPEMGTVNLIMKGGA